MIQTQSTNRMNRMNAHSRASTGPLYLTFRLNSRKNGTAKWNTISASPTHFQPVFTRGT